MKNNEQGVLHKDKLPRLFIHILSLIFLCLSNSLAAETSAGISSGTKDLQKQHVYVIYSEDNPLHTGIINKLSVNLKRKQTGISLKTISPGENVKSINNDTDIIIAMGSSGMRSADRDYPNTNKLFIATDPNSFRLDAKRNKNDAILYMAQSYCRQLNFIKLLNRDWKTISILSSKKKPVDRKKIQQCANSYGINIYFVSTTAEENITNKIKHALHHSDALLALPDSNIYNSKSVKNILLTSYRHRKPVIAFSSNFVSAGALASIHSDTEQIAQSASQIITRYYDTRSEFEDSINHPDEFDIGINRQVSRALDLSIPDLDELKQSLQKTTKHSTKGSR